MQLRIGELLLQRGAITRDQLDRAVSAQQRWGARLGMCLVRLGFVAESQLAQMLSEQLGIPAATAGAFDQIPASVIQRVPASIAITHGLVPLAVSGRELSAALADPQNLVRLDAISFAIGLRIRPVLATEIAIAEALARYYPGASRAPAEVPEAPASEGQADVWDKPLTATGESRAMRRMHLTPPLGTAILAPAPPPPQPAASPEPTARKQRALAALGRALEGSAAARSRSQTPLEVPLSTERTSPGMPAFQPSPPPPPDQSPFAALAAVTSRAGLAATVGCRIGQLVPSFCLLEIEQMTARCGVLQVAGGARPRPREAIPLDGAHWLVDVRTRACLEAVEAADDRHLAALLEWVGLQPAGTLLLGPIMEDGAVRYVVLGQDPKWDNNGLATISRKLRRYLTAASDALRMLALREHLASWSDDDPEERSGTPLAPPPPDRPTSRYAVSGDALARSARTDARVRRQR
jgi:hypothetical protein